MASVGRRAEDPLADERDRASAGPSSMAPPSYEAIVAFMRQHTARLPSHVVDCGVAPYEYTGCDYALVLYACFPAKCVDLTQLCWSLQPIEAQLVGNLQVFCQAARHLQLVDAPVHALEPARLQPRAACTVHHLHVQHWLFSLALRFPPSQSFDATAIRAANRWLQVGEPYLQRCRSSSSGATATEAIINDPGKVCGAVKATPCVSMNTLLTDWAPVMSPTPAYTPVPEVPAEDNKPGSSSMEECHGASKSVTAALCERPKPWLNYSKPWRLPTLQSTQARKAVADAEAKRRELEMRRDPAQTAFASTAANLQEQYMQSEAAVAKVRDQLAAVRQAVMAQLLAGYATVDFQETADKLRKTESE